VGIHQKATPALAAKAIEEAWSFFPEWSRTEAGERVGMLRRTAQVLRNRKLEFDAWLVYEAGKTWPEAEADVCEAIDFCEYYALEMERLSGPQPVSQLPGEKDEMRYIPLGVGLVIPPWNFPLAILAGMTVAALVAGNTVVLKPSSETPTIAAKFAEALLEAGFPERSFCLLTGSGSAIGDLLVQHPKTRFVAFTGSRDVGLRINELAARHQKGQLWIKRVIAEMGGKDAIVVDADCDLDKAVEGVAVSAFGYQGQKCSACSRAIVDEKVYKQFLEKLQARVETIRMGAADDPANYMGPVISDGARKSILSYIEVGKSEGRLLTGGTSPDGDGYFVRPTVIADIEPSAKIFQEEIFGPVLAVIPYEDDDDAVRIANDSRYGLSGAVNGKDLDRAYGIAKRIRSGTVAVNGGQWFGPDSPFGGYKESGLGREHGMPGFEEYLETKTIGLPAPG
jgi:1-pyrroline-5-carboxylate dehydrogenase